MTLVGLELKYACPSIQCAKGIIISLCLDLVPFFVYARPIQANLYKIQGLFKDFLKDFPTVFKD